MQFPVSSLSASILYVYVMARIHERSNDCVQKGVQIGTCRLVGINEGKLAVQKQLKKKKEGRVSGR